MFICWNRAPLEERVEDDELLSQERDDGEHGNRGGAQDGAAMRALDDEQRGDDKEHPHRVEQVTAEHEHGQEREEDGGVGGAMRVEPAREEQRAQREQHREWEGVEEPVFIEHRGIGLSTNATVTSAASHTRTPTRTSRR